MAKILVVDDEKDIRAVFKESLTLNGHDVDTATNGEDGLKKIKKTKYDIVLLDVRMPKVSGIQLLEKIRKLDKNLKVIMVSVINTEEARKKASDLGIEGYIVKPLSNEHLNRAITLAMTKRRED